MERNPLSSILKIGLLLAAGGVAAFIWHAVADNAVEPVEEFTTMNFADWTGISAEAKSQRDVFFKIPDVVAVEKTSGVVMCSVEVLPFSDFDGRNVEFAGDASRFNNFVTEIRFLREHGVTRYAGEAGKGVRDDIESLFGSIWQLLRHPIDSLTNMGEGVWKFGCYVVDAIKGGKDVSGDLHRVISAYYDNKLAEVGASYGLDSEIVILPETKDTLSQLTKTRIGGAVTIEIATLFLAVGEAADAGKAAEVTAKAGEASKAAEAGSATAKAGEIAEDASLLRKAKLFPFGQKILASRQSVAEIANVVSHFRGRITRILSTKIDPVRLAAKESRRAANRYINQSMYVLNAGEKAGWNPGVLIDEAFKSCGADKKLGEFYHDPELAKRTLLYNYSMVKNGGVLDDVDNLRRLQFGNSPIMKKGQYAGQLLEVDHTIPIAVDPSLSANIANLKYLPSSINRAKGMKITDESEALARDLEKSMRYKPSLQTAPI